MDIVSQPIENVKILDIIAVDGYVAVVKNRFVQGNLVTLYVGRTGSKQISQVKGTKIETIPN